MPGRSSNIVGSRAILIRIFALFGAVILSAYNAYISPERTKCGTQFARGVRHLVSHVQANLKMRGLIMAFRKNL